MFEYERECSLKQFNKRWRSNINNAKVSKNVFLKLDNSEKIKSARRISNWALPWNSTRKSEYYWTEKKENCNGWIVVVVVDVLP